MSFMLTRMFAYLTLFTYLMVGTMAVRFFIPEMTTVEVSPSYLELFKKYEVRSALSEEIVTPHMAFQEIKIQNEVKVAKLPTRRSPPSISVPAPTQVAQMKMETVTKNELPFHEPVTLQAIEIEQDLPQNLASLYVEFKYDMVAENKLAEDTISTAMAANEAEPEFFEFPVAAQEVAKKEEPSQSPVTGETLAEDTQTSISEMASPETDVILAEEVSVDDLIAFDYSKVKEDMKEQTLPTISKMTTQPSIPEAAGNFQHQKWDVKKSGKKKKSVTSHLDNKTINKLNKGLLPASEVTAPKTYPNRVTIQLSGSNLKETREEIGFEVRFQDDLNETFQDYNNGTVTVDQELSQPKMTRAMTILKRGYAPTNTDLILEEGVSEIVLPAFEESTFNELLAPFERRGPIGAVLVELDETVTDATLDVPYSQVMKLDGDLKVTEAEDYRYLFFIGVKAGNALLSYKENNNEKTSKVIHVHEHELTFETNFFEEVANEKIKLLEEDLLSKEKAPLIISSEEVRQFASEKVSKKINNHTYKMQFNKTLLGGRRYLELTHQAEPIFVGLKDSDTAIIPSENLMRFILSRFENAKLGNRCLVQVNLSKMATKIDVSAESTAQSLMTYTQVLDSDGKFYDSVGAKTKKIIIVGENQGAPGISQDAKVNVKISYADGSVQFLGSYCSPNTYLVEQL